MKPWTVVSWVVLGACGGNSPVAMTPPAPVFQCTEAGAWTPLRTAPSILEGRVDHTAVWTGQEMILWGGTQNMRSPFSDGARYNPNAATWRPTSRIAAPIERDDHVAVWTGAEMIVWGGNSYRESLDKLDSGGRYDPEKDRWRATPSLGLSARDDPRAVWTGIEMIVWGGRDEDGHSDTGARYNPTTNTVRPVGRAGAPQPREDHTIVWTGTEMIVWGGWNGDDRARNYALNGARYNPTTDTWRPLTGVGAPESREDHTAMWSGTEMLVWGGVRREGSPAEQRQLGTGGRYSPETDTWTPITRVDAPDAREDDVVVWTGEQMLVWGGQHRGIPLQSGGRYVPRADTWCPMTADHSPLARRDHAGVWTGQSLVLWGGKGTGGDYLPTGATYAVRSRSVTRPPRPVPATPSTVARDTPRSLASFLTAGDKNLPPCNWGLTLLSLAVGCGCAGGVLG